MDKRANSRMWMRDTGQAWRPAKGRYQHCNGEASSPNGHELCGEEYVDWGVSARKPGRSGEEQQGTVSKCKNTGAAENPGLAGTSSVEASRSFWWQPKTSRLSLEQWRRLDWRMSSLTMDSGLVHNTLTGRVGLTW